jgi:hypothetical protein
MTDIYGLGDLNDILGGSDDDDPDLVMEMYDDFMEQLNDTNFPKSKRFSHRSRVVYEPDGIIPGVDEEANKDDDDSDNEDDSDNKNVAKVNPELDDIYDDPLDMPDMDIRFTEPSHHKHGHRVRHNVAHDQDDGQNEYPGDVFDDYSDDDIDVWKQKFDDSDSDHELPLKQGSSDITSGSELLAMFEHIVGGVLGGASFADIQEHYVNGGTSELSRHYNRKFDLIYPKEFTNVGSAIDAAIESNRSGGNAEVRDSKHHHPHNHNQKKDPVVTNDNKPPLAELADVNIDDLYNVSYENGEQAIELPEEPFNDGHLPTPDELIDAVFNDYYEPDEESS